MRQFPSLVAGCLLVASVSLICVDTHALAEDPPVKRQPLVRVVDLDVGESAEVELADGRKVEVKLLEVDEQRDPIRDAIRLAVVKVEVDGQPLTIESANYRLPQTIGQVQIDCPITKGYNTRSHVPNHRTDVWGLVKDARLRLWPAGSPLTEPGTFGYPAKQRWFATMTQMANEPAYVDGGETPTNVNRVYYHFGLDIGGSEGQVEVVAATDGQVVSVGKEVLPEHAHDTPVAPRYDVIYMIDNQGWYYRYSHLVELDVELGQRVKLGQKIGTLGKEGASGGWAHLHFDITARQPSGFWGIVDGYPLIWEAYRREYQPKILAVARPHHLVRTGEEVTLDATRCWSDSGIAKYEWTLSNGTTSTDPKPKITYDRAGTYSEVLKVTDNQGHVDYDFTVVQVLLRENERRLPPTIHAAYWPTQAIQPGDEVTFKVRTFRTTDNEEIWDFGDGSPEVKVKSDGNVKTLAKDGYAITTHRFEKPGHYIVSVHRANDAGMTATAKLHVVVEEPHSATPSN